jgi:hypothetical protein
MRFGAQFVIGLLLERSIGEPRVAFMLVRRA